MNTSCRNCLLIIFLPILSLSAQIPANTTNGLAPRSISDSSYHGASEFKAPATNSGITRERYTLPSTYTSNSVTMSDGQKYTGSKKGIIMWDKYAPLEITTENSHIPDDHVTALALDGNNNLWIGTYNDGIVIGIQRDIKPFKVQKVITHDKCIFSIYADPQGLVWVVYRNGGLECFKQGVACAFFPS